MLGSLRETGLTSVQRHPRYRGRPKDADALIRFQIETKGTMNQGTNESLLRLQSAENGIPGLTLDRVCARDAKSAERRSRSLPRSHSLPIAAFSKGNLWETIQPSVGFVKA
jgi:hypothetical protein